MEGGKNFFKKILSNLYSNMGLELNNSFDKESHAPPSELAKCPRKKDCL